MAPHRSKIDCNIIADTTAEKIHIITSMPCTVIGKRRMSGVCKTKNYESMEGPGNKELCEIAKEIRKRKCMNAKLTQ